VSPEGAERPKPSRRSTRTTLDNGVDESTAGGDTPAAEVTLAALESRSRAEIEGIAGTFGVADTSNLKQTELIYRILQAQAERQGNIFAGGVLQIVDEGFGFLRQERLLPGQADVYVSQSQIRRFGLRTGDWVTGHVRPPKEAEKYFGLLRVEAVNGQIPDVARQRPHFEALTPVHPNELLKLEADQKNLSQRLVDITSPIGKGQRVLLVSPPKAGKTMLMKAIAQGITANHPDVRLIVALVGEGPGEGTDMRRAVAGGGYASKKTKKNAKN